MINHVENYLQWLRANMAQNVIRDGMIEVTTPFLDRHNDYTQIYVIDSGKGKYTVSDDGYTINDLEMCGVELTTSKRKDIFHHTLNRMGVKYNEASQELYIECSQKDLPAAQHRLIQSVLDVNDMFYLAGPTVKSLFFEDVSTYFDKNEIYYTNNVSFIGQSGFPHSYDFLLQRNKTHSERFIKLMNAPTRGNAERYLFAWDDTKSVRQERNGNHESKLIVLINDTKPVSSNIIECLNQYQVQPIPWSQRDQQKEAFG